MGIGTEVKPIRAVQHRDTLDHTLRDQLIQIAVNRRFANRRVSLNNRFIYRIGSGMIAHLLYRLQHNLPLNSIPGFHKNYSAQKPTFLGRWEDRLLLCHIFFVAKNLSPRIGATLDSISYQ